MILEASEPVLDLGGPEVLRLEPERVASELAELGLAWPNAKVSAPDLVALEPAHLEPSMSAFDPGIPRKAPQIADSAKT
jgi:hypothetical protein